MEPVMVVLSAVSAAWMLRKLAGGWSGRPMTSAGFKN
jgi:hypothetical protein